MPSGPDLVRSPEICASGSEVPGFVFGILIIFFVIGISLAVQPDSSLANLPLANDRASNRPGVPSQTSGMRISDSRPLRSRGCVPTKIADLQIRPVENRFVTLDISTLSFPHSFGSKDLRFPKFGMRSALP
jgi:hypothetical protein